MLTTTLQRIADLTQIDLKHKTFDELFGCPVEEIGELARELKIEEKVFGNDYKTPDEGSKAEAVDLFIGATCMYLARNAEVYDVVRHLETELEEFVPTESVWKHLRDAAQNLADCEYNAKTAKAAMKIFYQRGGRTTEFVETVHKKLDKWEASQKGLLAKKITDSN